MISRLLPSRPARALLATVAAILSTDCVGRVPMRGSDVATPAVLADVVTCMDADTGTPQDISDLQPAQCGDGKCNGLETCVTCLQDCGECPGQCIPSCDPVLEECVQVTAGGGVCTSKMAAIPAGNFWMGCNNCAGSTVNDISCISDEHPYHEVYLDAYEIDKTEVTVDQYGACMSAGKCDPIGVEVDCGNLGTANYLTPGNEQHPMNCMNWFQSDQYCKWVGKELCTEAQWEKGARGGCEKNGGPSNCMGQSRMYPWGNDTPTCDLAAMTGCHPGTQVRCSSSPVGDSPYGLCDMAGNVEEWVADCKLDDYYCDGPAASGAQQDCTECGPWPGSPQAWSNPPGPAGGSPRGLRGGCYSTFPTSLRVSHRNAYLPSGKDCPLDHFGTRCCRSE